MMRTQPNAGHLVDLSRVAIFVKVVEHGGFTAAARAIGLPKSSVSRAVKLLEEELGARLLRRSTRSIGLTEAGAAFYERAARGLSAIDEAREAVVELESEVRGPVRLTAPVDAGVWMLAPILTSFAERYPAVSVDLVLTSRVVDLAEEGFDLALRAGSIGDDRLVAKALAPLDFALYASAAYIAAHGAPRRVADLTKHHCVPFRAARGRTTWTLIGPRGEAQVEVGGPIAVDDFSCARAIVASGGGIGLLPQLFAESPGATPLTRLLPKHRAPGAPLYLAHTSGRYLPRRVAALRDFLLAALR